MTRDLEINYAKTKNSQFSQSASRQNKQAQDVTRITPYIFMSEKQIFFIEKKKVKEGYNISNKQLSTQRLLSGCRRSIINSKIFTESEDNLIMQKIIILGS